MELTGKVIEIVKKYYDKDWDAMILLNHPYASMLFVNEILYKKIDKEEFHIYNVEIMELLDYIYHIYCCEHNYHMYDVINRNDLKSMIDDYLVESRRDYIYNILTIDDIISFIDYKTNIIKNELSKLLNIKINKLYTLTNISNYKSYYIIATEERRCLIFVKR